MSAVQTGHFYLKPHVVNLRLLLTTKELLMSCCINVALIRREVLLSKRSKSVNIRFGGNVYSCPKGPNFQLGGDNYSAASIPLSVWLSLATPQIIPTPVGHQSVASIKFPFALANGRFKMAQLRAESIQEG